MIITLKGLKTNANGIKLIWVLIQAFVSFLMMWFWK